MDDSQVQIINKDNQQVPTIFDIETYTKIKNLAIMFSNSELVPDIYKVTSKENEAKAIANCMIAIDFALRMNLSPLVIMQNLSVIKGKPSWASTFMISQANNCGRFNRLKFREGNSGNVGKVEYTEYVKEPRRSKDGKEYSVKVPVKRVFDGKDVPNLYCEVYTTQKNDDEELTSMRIDVKMAIQEGWYTSNNSKWVSLTKQMLRYRAASFWVKTFAPEILSGMQTREEAEEMSYVDAEEVPSVKEEIKERANKEVFDINQPAETVVVGGPAKPKVEPKPAPKPEPEQPKQEPKVFPVAEQKVEPADECPY